MAQADQFLIIVEDRVGIREGGTGVDLCVIWIDHDPGSAGSEACVRRIVPLHGGAGIVAADGADALHHFICGNDLLFGHILPVGVDLLDVSAVFQRGKGRIGHTQFLSLVDIRCAFLHMQAGGEHFCRQDAPFWRIVAEAGDCPGLVVIVPVETSPGFSLELQLPFVEDTADAGHTGLSAVPFSDLFLLHDAVGVLEVEDHAKL